MSELKTRFIDDTYAEYFNTGKHELAQIYLKSEADKVIAHNKHKRCLDMAWGCQQRMELFHELVLEEARTITLPNEEALKEYRNKRERAAKWKKRWLNLAKKFKEAK